MIDSGVLYALGVALVFVGVLIIVIAVILLFVSNAGKGEAKGAGVIIIGPVPIVFGTDKKSVRTVLAFAVVLTIVLLVATIMYYWLLR